MFNVHRNYDLTTGVKNNSIAVVSDGYADIKVLYHKTIVFEFKRTPKNRTITLRNGGWDTISTRLVINRALSEIGCTEMRIEKQKIKGRKDCKPENITCFVDSKNDVVLPFVDGMLVKL